jgi:hypothetical protein
MVIGLRMAVLYRALRAASPPREPLVYRQTALTYRIIRGRHASVEGVHAGIEVPDRVRFRLQPETGFDRRAKRFGLATEWQANDRNFDDNVFVVSDDPIFLRALSSDRELREHALALMKAFGGATIRCSAGCLWVETKAGLCGASKEDERIAEPVAHKAVQHLLAIRDRIQVIAATAWDTNRDHSVGAELALYVFLELLGIAGIVAFLFGGGSGENRQLLFSNTGSWAAGTTLVIAAVVLPLSVAVMRKSSRAHLMLFEVVLLGIPGVAGLAFGATCWANRHEDDLPAVQQVVQVQDRYVTPGRRNRKNYHLVMDWPDSRVDKEFGVSAEVYHQYDTAGCAEVVWHRGYLNDPFLSAMQPVQCDPHVAIEPERAQH